MFVLSVAVPIHDKFREFTVPHTPPANAPFVPDPHDDAPYNVETVPACVFVILGVTTFVASNPPTNIITAALLVVGVIELVVTANPLPIFHALTAGIGISKILLLSTPENETIEPCAFELPDHENLYD